MTQNLGFQKLLITCLDFSNSFPIILPKWLIRKAQGRLFRLSDLLFLNVTMTVFKIMIKYGKVFYKAKQEYIKLNIL